MNKLSFFAFLILGVTAFAMEDYESQAAVEKQAIIREHISGSLYNEYLPAITGPGLMGKLELMSSKFAAKAFSNNGDFMASDRKKDIHTFGTVAEVAFIINPDSALKLTGLFASGAQYGVIRISLAEPPEETHFIPGFALKMFRSNHHSANVFAMPGLDGQYEYDLFANDYLTSLPSPCFHMKTAILACRFTKALAHLGQKNGNIRALNYEDMASITEDGVGVDVPVAPYAMVFRPTKDAKDLFAKKEGVDFRRVFEGRGEGIVLFDVYAQMAKDEKQALHIGTIKATSNFFASFFGDEILFFKHPKAHEL